MAGNCWAHHAKKNLFLEVRLERLRVWLLHLFCLKYNSIIGAAIFGFLSYQNFKAAERARKDAGKNNIMNKEHLDDLISYLKFPSVSTDSQYKENVRECAEWLV